MKLTARYRGLDAPFEGDRILALMALPSGAQVTKATVAVALARPSTDPNRFEERFAFGPIAGPGELPAQPWAVTKVLSADAVEIDFHARRALAEVEGANLKDAELAIDVGGVYVDVNERGAVRTPSDPQFKVKQDGRLPGATVTRFRLVQSLSSAKPDVDVVAIRSVPSNLSVRIGQLPPVWTRIGELTDGDRSPDFASVLQAFLADADVVNGVYAVPVVVHADGISRLDVEIAVEYLRQQSLLPDGLDEVVLPFDLGTAPKTQGQLLAASLPPNATVAPGATTARLWGAFEATRIAPIPIGAPAPAVAALVTAGRSQAQPIRLASDLVASAVDLLLQPLTRVATLTVTLLPDSDGKPLGDPLLPRPIEVRVSREASRDPTWIGAPLSPEFHFEAGRTYWLVVQAIDGEAALRAGAALAGQPSLQTSVNGGLSWRETTDPQVAGPLAALIHLRITPAQFTLPVSLEVGEGADRQAVPLDSFQPLGRVDFRLDVPELAEAFTRYVQRRGDTTCPTGNHLANGDFTDWIVVGDELVSASQVEPAGSPRALALSTDGRTAYLATVVAVVEPVVADEPTASATAGRSQLEPIDLICLLPDAPIALDDGDFASEPFFVAVHPGGARVYVATQIQDSSTAGRHLHVIDAQAGRPVGSPIDLPFEAAKPVDTVSLALNPDGSRLYLTVWDSPAHNVRIEFYETNVLDRAALDASAASTTPAAALQLDAAETPGKLTVAPSADGDLLCLLVDRGTDPGTLRLLPASHPDDAVSVTVGKRPSGVAAAGDGSRVVVVHATETDLLMVDAKAPDQGALSIPLKAVAVAVALSADGLRAFAVSDGGLEVLDVVGRHAVGSVALRSGIVDVAVSPHGDQVYVPSQEGPSVAVIGIGAPQPAEWALTSGSVEPRCLNGELVAVLGQALRVRLPRPGPVTGGGADPGRDIPSMPREPSVLSQVAPAVAGCSYDFRFQGLAARSGAVAELLWRGDDCSALRTDAMPIQAFDLLEADPAKPRARAIRAEEPVLVLHDLQVTAPQGATQVEARFRIPASGIAAIDKVSLAATANLVANADLGQQQGDQPAGWKLEPAGAAVSFELAGQRIRVGNHGAATAALVQTLPVVAEQGFALELEGRVVTNGPGGAEPRIELRWRPPCGAAASANVVQPLLLAAFDQYLAEGVVPGRISEAEVRLELPPGAIVEVARISVQQPRAVPVPVNFRGKAPGELTASEARVVYDVIDPPPAAPETELCPPTPLDPRAGRAACPCCGSDQPPKARQPAVTLAGRPANVGTCRRCGAELVSLGGRLVAGAQTVFAATVPARAAGPAFPNSAPVSTLPLTAVKGIGAGRARRLATVGLGSLPRLAGASPRVVAGMLKGVTMTRAEQLIARARQLLESEREKDMRDTPK